MEYGRWRFWRRTPNHPCCCNSMSVPASKAGADPVAWIKAHPGRIRSMHCKDWSPEAAKKYSVLFGEGVADWKALFQAAENGGGIEYYLVEQEGSRFSELDTARKCLQAFRAM